MKKTITKRPARLKIIFGCLAALALMSPLVSPDNALAVDPDQYEPDDSYSKANVIVLNSDTAQRHNFHDTGDQDWVKFYGISDVTYSIKASNLGARCDAVLEVYQTDGATMIAGPTDDGGAGEDELLEWTCTKDGLYYAKVAQYDPSVFGDNTEYDLRVYKPVGPFPGFVEGTIADTDTKAPIKGAQVTTDYDVSALSITDGTYLMIHQAGTFTAIARASGYSPTSFSVEVREGSTTAKDIELEQFCLSAGNDTSIPMPCADYNGTRYGFTLNSYSNPSDPTVLYWKMNRDTLTFGTSTDCIDVGSDLAIPITCVEYVGTKYEFTLNYYSNPADPSGLYWKMGVGTLKVK